MVAVIEDLNPVSIGVDVGQLHDNTALSVAEAVQSRTGKFRPIERVPAHINPNNGQFVPAKDAEETMLTQYIIRAIRRLALGTSYPDVAIHIADLLCSPLLLRRKVRVLIDVTGVGRPVYEDLKKEIDHRKYGVWLKDGVLSKREICDVIVKPISFVHGETYNKKTGALGKAFLVSRLQSLLQSTRVHAPDTAEMKATVEELRVYQIKIDNDGKDTYGASVGKHDDLATALGLSCLEDPFAERVSYSRRVY